MFYLRMLIFVVHKNYLMNDTKNHVNYFLRKMFSNKNQRKIRGHPGSNRGPLDLQSNALPLSYIPMLYCGEELSFKIQLEK